MPGPGEDASSYFAMGNNNQASTSSTPAVTPGINTTPAVTPGGGLGGAPGGRKLKGEAKAAVAEEKRLGTGTVDERPAWWLDVMCPTVADMRELRKVSRMASSPREDTFLT
jgi:Mg2+ and Co2+ transporter CorA